MFKNPFKSPSKSSITFTSPLKMLKKSGEAISPVFSGFRKIEMGSSTSDEEANVCRTLSDSGNFRSIKIVKSSENEEFDGVNLTLESFKDHHYKKTIDAKLTKSNSSPDIKIESEYVDQFPASTLQVSSDVLWDHDDRNSESQGESNQTNMQIFYEPRISRNASGSQDEMVLFRNMIELAGEAGKIDYNESDVCVSFSG